MAKNEAKIKFVAETGDFNSAVKQSKDQMSLLNAQMKLNETQMKATGTTVEGLQQKQKLLTEKQKEQQNVVEALNGKLQKAVECFGENSTEATKLKTQLANAQRAEEKIKQEIDQCNDELEKQNKTTRTAKDIFKEFGKEVKEAGEDVKDTTEGFTVMKGALANLVADGIQAAVSGMKEFVSSTVDLGVDFNSTMSAVQAISGATGDDLQALTDKAMELGSSTVFSATDVSEAMVEMAKAGWTTEQILGGMAGVLNATSASGEELSLVATITADAISGFGLKAEQSTQVADLLTQAANSGTIGIEELGETFKYISPVAGSMGLSIEDVTTAVTAMSMAGIKGSQAGTSLRTMLTNLVKPTDAMQAAMDKLGIEVANADGTMKPLDEIISILRNSFSGLTEEEKTFYAATLAGKEGMSGMLSIMNLSKDEYDAIAKSMENAKGVAEETSSVMLDNMGGDLEELGGNIETLKLELFDTFEGTMRNGIGVLNSFVDGIRTATQWLTEHKGAVAAVAVVIGILTTAITAYNVVQGIKAAMDAAQVTTVWALVSAHIAQAAAAIAAVAPYILIVAAIAAVIAIIVLCIKYWDEIVIALEKAWEAIKAVWAKVATWFTTNVINPVKNTFTNMWNGLKNGAKNAWQGIKDTFGKVASFFSDVFGKAWTKVKNIFSTGGKIFDGIKDGIASAFKSIVNKIISGINRVVSIPFSAINTALGKIRNVSIMGKEPFSWIPTISVPKIPLLAEGGILTRPTLNIAGEAGPEAIIPIEKLQSFMDGALERTLQRDNVSQLVAAVEDLANRPIELNINGHKFAVATAPDTDTVNGGRIALRQRGLAL